MDAKNDGGPEGVGGSGAGEIRIDLNCVWDTRMYKIW